MAGLDPAAVTETVELEIDRTHAAAFEQVRVAAIVPGLYYNRKVKSTGKRAVKKSGPKTRAPRKLTPKPSTPPCRRIDILQFA